MSDTVIKVSNLSKKYLIRHQQRERYVALRDVLTNKAKNTFNRGIVQPFKRLANSTTQQFNNLTSASLSNSTIQSASNSTISQFNSSSEDFFALRDVSFEVKRGDRVGIIGRNGAGKSTLLKILSRITEPTTGRVEIKGRVASLLEVGTGFHPELTGRENIFLNGAILGMTRAEIKRKFDEIVDFAEIEKFLDTPVKHFSSGMYVRLAFAVAAHLEPEILIVDEVLAVGDAQFQKKCLGKMEEVGKEGRTVLFVSHNMGSISVLCDTCILLEYGQIKLYGETQPTIAAYNRNLKINRDGKVAITSLMRNRGNGAITLKECSIVNIQGELASSFLIGEDIKVEFILGSSFSGTMSFWLIIFDSSGRPLLSTHQRDWELVSMSPGTYHLTYQTEKLSLMPDTYFISAGAFDSQLNFLEWVDNCQTFEVLPCFANGQPYDSRWGAMSQPASWTLKRYEG